MQSGRGRCPERAQNASTPTSEKHNNIGESPPSTTPLTTPFGLVSTGRSTRSGLYWYWLLDPVGVGGGQINLGKGLVLTGVFSCCSAFLRVWVVSAVLVRDWVVVEEFGVRVWCSVLRRSYVSPSCCRQSRAEA
ncbi:hypothetical protein RHGRI_017106 [Rhododendron griersonianum]|uniref:Uncharacterized protein n=1 Tax=Rhododendron griersonianum TaxID=479676 RepID=A0AAV6JWK9_9ERIC|nr:hypothetical protein RHGRI_017106 [Rhododendron griersonianum]